MRAPFMIRWPGKIPSGSVSNEIVHVVDLLPTLGKIADYDVPNDRIIDGVDQLAFFTGKQKKSNREGFIIHTTLDLEMQELAEAQESDDSVLIVNLSREQYRKIIYTGRRGVIGEMLLIAERGREALMLWLAVWGIVPDG